MGEQESAVGTSLAPDNFALSGVKKAHLEALLKWGLAYPFETVSLAFHAELFEPGLLTRVSLLGLDLVLALGHSRLCGVGRCALFDIGVSRG